MRPGVSASAAILEEPPDEVALGELPTVIADQWSRRFCTAPLQGAMRREHSGTTAGGAWGSRIRAREPSLCPRCSDRAATRPAGGRAGAASEIRVIGRGGAAVPWVAWTIWSREPR